MIQDVLLGLGLMAVIEGLVLALAPLRFEDIIKALAKMSRDQRRSLGVIIMALGVILVWVAKNWA